MIHLKESAYRRNQYLLLNLKKNDANEIYEHQFSTNATFLYPYTKKLHTCTSIFTKAYCSLIIAKYLCNIGITFPGHSRGIPTHRLCISSGSIILQRSTNGMLNQFCLVNQGQSYPILT